jgi:magnesium-protoporphyrin O-methyltransferase
MMAAHSYTQRRGQLEIYFDRTAADAWARLTSTEKVSRIRQTVRDGRDRMRQVLLGWLPADLRGARVLDAGCGTGALATEAARRGAEVVAIDLSAKLVELAHRRVPPDLGSGSIEFLVGDMLDPALGRFDHVVSMDSLIHYRAQDTVGALDGLVARTGRSIVFTFAPKTPLLAAMHSVGRLFPRGNRAPAIEPVSETTLRRLFAASPAALAWLPGRTERINSGFYTSQALELVRR